ncbi:MAG: hypothetical protein V1726_04150, partial [Methanobacteriota archaeon]
MKIKIVMVSLLIVFLLSLLPSISAVEFNIASDANKSLIHDEISSLNNDELRTFLMKIYEKRRDNDIFFGGVFFLLLSILGFFIVSAMEYYDIQGLVYFSFIFFLYLFLLLANLLG